MQRRILTIVITYFPEKNLLEKNISSIINEVEKILIWENTPADKRVGYRLPPNGKIDYSGDGINSISHA